MQHLDEGTIHAWLDGALPADENTRIQEHVEHCADCAAMVAEARGMIAGASRIVSALDVVPAGVIPLQPRRQSTPKSLWRTLRLSPARAALAASLLITAATLVSVRHETALKAVTQRPGAAPAPTPVVAATPQVAPTTGLGRQADAAHRPSKLERREAVDSAVVASSAASNTAAGAVSRGAVAGSASAAATPPATALAAVAESKAVAKSVAAPAPLRAMTDSSARDAAGAPAFAGRRSFPSATALSQVVATSATADRANAGLEGCYQVVRDSTAWLSPLPRRFQLDHIDSGSTKGTVRAVTADGRIDSLVPATMWRPLSANMASIEWTTGAELRSLTLHVGGVAGVAGVAQANSSGQSRSLIIARMDCRR